jgi:hypothetical protein
MQVSARNFGYVFGAAYIVVGLVGFALTGFSDFAAPDGHMLLFFEINPLHNVVHLLIGSALVGAATVGELAARRVAGAVVVTYALVGVLGFFLVDQEALNIFALNHADNALHLLSAASGLLVLTRTTAPARA